MWFVQIFSRNNPSTSVEFRQTKSLNGENSMRAAFILMMAIFTITVHGEILPYTTQELLHLIAI
jgi:hypothetical protein